MDNMDAFNFIFNNSEGLFDFKDEKKRIDTKEPKKNEELKLLKKHIHTKNQIILQLIEQCDAYSKVVAEILKSASDISDVDVNMKNKVEEISKAIDAHNKLNEMLKMTIEFEEMMDSNENHTV